MQGYPLQQALVCRNSKKHKNNPLGGSTLGPTLLLGCFLALEMNLRMTRFLQAWDEDSRYSSSFTIDTAGRYPNHIHLSADKKIHELLIQSFRLTHSAVFRQTSHNRGTLRHANDLFSSLYNIFSIKPSDEIPCSLYRCGRSNMELLLGLPWFP